MGLLKSINRSWIKSKLFTKGIPLYLKGLEHRPLDYLFQRRSFSSGSHHLLSRKFIVSSFGTLKVQSSKFDAVTISPIDPVECPDQNVSTVKILGGPGKLSSDLEDIVNNENQVLSIDDSNLPHSEDLYRLDVQLPMKYDVNINSKDLKTLNIRNLENGEITVRGVTEMCSLRNIKSGGINIQASGGDILSESTLQADGILQTTGKGKISLDKPVCQELKVQTEKGDITLNNSYSRSLNVTTHSGDITIGNAHRRVSVDIKENGKLKIDTLDGTLDAKVKSGFVDVYVSQHDVVNVQMESGDIVLKLDSSKETELSLTGNEIITDEQFEIKDTMITAKEDKKTLIGQLHVEKEERSRTGRKDVIRTTSYETKPRIQASTGEGSIVLKCKDWFSVFKLGEYLSQKE